MPDTGYHLLPTRRRARHGFVHPQTPWDVLAAEDGEPC